MKGFFNSKKSPKKHATGEDVENYYQHQAAAPPVNNINQKQQPEPSSPLRSASTSNKSPKKSTRPASPVQPAPAQRERDSNSNSKSRSSRSFVRHSSDHISSSSRRSKHDPNTHPLNLPPDEYKRLSALSAMSDRSSIDKMDVDKETPPNPPSSPPATSQPQAQASYTVPISSPTNGTKDASAKSQAKSPTNGERPAPASRAGPAPPPHGSRPSSPVPTAADEAESYKAAGNKFFKEKDYRNAIIQYTKGKEENNITSSLVGDLTNSNASH